MVSISGCDPLDPGSNPGTAIIFLFFPYCFLVKKEKKEKNTPEPGIEPGSPA